MDDFGHDIDIICLDFWELDELLVVGLVLGILHHPRSSLSIDVITNYPTVQIQWYHQSILSHVLILFNEDNPKISCVNPI
jgi:hypothetical protein